MKTYDKIVESFAVLFDPTQPERQPAFDLHVLRVIDPEDGSAPYVDPRVPRRVMGVAQAAEAGLALPEIAAAMATDAVVAMQAVQTELARVNVLLQEANLRVETLQAEVETLKENLPGSGQSEAAPQE